MSKTKKQIIWGAIGLLYAFVYGFFTMLATGGGHGNFIWFILFLTVEFIGLYFPLMAILAVDLRRRATKMIFGTLIGFNLIASSVVILGWIQELPDGKPTDFQKMTQYGVKGVIFNVAVHFLPTILFAGLLIKSIFYGAAPPDEEAVLSLNLRED